MEHGPTLAQGIPPHSWQVALLATLRMNTQLVHGRCWPWHWCGESGWREEMHVNHMV